MELGKRAVVLVLMMVALFGVVAMGEVYKVGESNGWTNTAPIFDYKAWAASKTFHAGDTIRTFSLFFLFYFVIIKGLGLAYAHLN